MTCACVCVCARCTLKRSVPLMSVCAVSMPYGSAYLVLSRFGKPSRLKPGKQSMGVVESIRAPPAGILTTWTHTHTGSQVELHTLLASPAAHQGGARYLAVPQEDGGVDGVEQDAVRTPAELVAQRVVGTLWSRETATEGDERLHLGHDTPSRVHRTISAKRSTTSQITTTRHEQRRRRRKATTVTTRGDVKKTHQQQTF